MLDLKRTTKFFYTKHFSFGLIAVGFLLRLRSYLEDRSLWLDEAALALEIIRRSFVEMFYNLSYNPSSPTAPAGFLLLEKGAIQLIANNEHVLRLCPFLFSILSIWLFYVLLKNLNLKGSPAALGLFVFSGPLIIYSATVKSYSCDVLVAVTMLWIAEKIRRDESSIREIVLFGAVGAAALWFSYGALFVLPGIGATLVVFSVIKKQKKKTCLLVLSGALWVVSLIGVYAFHLSDLLSNGEVNKMWVNAFMPWPIGSLESMAWLCDSFLNIFNDAAGISLVYLAGALFLLGCVRLVQRNKEEFGLIFSPFVIVLCAAGLHKYPFQGRFVLFLVPSLLIFIGEGVAWAASKTQKFSAAPTALLVGALFLYPVMSAASPSPVREGMKKVMLHFAANYKKGDLICLSNSAQYAYGYYHGGSGLKNNEEEIWLIADVAEEDMVFVPEEDIRRVIFRYDKGGYLAEQAYKEMPPKSLDRDTVSGRRVWLVFSHIREKHMEEILSYFGTLGVRVRELRDRKSFLYLYEINRMKNEG